MLNVLDIIILLIVGFLIGVVFTSLMVISSDKSCAEDEYDRGFSAGKEAARQQIIEKINKTYGVGGLFTDPEEKDN